MVFGASRWLEPMLMGTAIAAAISAARIESLFIGKPPSRGSWARSSPGTRCPSMRAGVGAGSQTAGNRGLLRIDRNCERFAVGRADRLSRSPRMRAARRLTGRVAEQRFGLFDGAGERKPLGEPHDVEDALDRGALRQRHDEALPTLLESLPEPEEELDPGAVDKAQIGQIVPHAQARVRHRRGETVFHT